MTQHKTEVTNSFQHAVLQGHGHELPSNSDVLVPLSELCSASHMETCTVRPDITHVPYSVACSLRSLVDTLVYISGEGREALLPG